MMIWQWGRRSLASAFYDFGVREGKKIEWLVALREKVDEIELAIQENLPAARQLIQGSRRLVESDRAAVFLCSRPVESSESYVPVVLRVFLKKYGVLPARVVLLHVNQMSVASIQEEGRYVVIKLGNDIHSVVVNYGYMEHPDVRNVLKELQRKKLLPIASERWIIEVGEEGSSSTAISDFSRRSSSSLLVGFCDFRRQRTSIWAWSMMPLFPRKSFRWFLARRELRFRFQN